jgi:hypothetical protein
MADQFGPHSRKYGPRLDQIQALGRRGGLAAQIVEEAGGKGPDPRPAAAELLPPANSNRKVGRPKFEGVRPWEAEGMSRAAWFRRKKGGG